MGKLKVMPILIFVVAALGDAGYLGSITAGAAPIGEHTSIVMTAEEVVIELRVLDITEGDWSSTRYYATITADFLFTNTGEADTVYTYIPVSVMTIFVSVLYGAVDMDVPLENPRVLVDGEPVEVYKLCVGNFDESVLEGGTWEEFAERALPLFDEQPENGEPFYFRRYFAGVEEHWDKIAHRADALLAYWEVTFEAGETKLVEYVQEFDLTSDYGEQVFRLTYPLFTGAGWRGDIGYGRVTVLPGEGCDWNDLRYYTGLHLPLPSEEEDHRFSLNEGITGHEGFNRCNLAGYRGGSFDHALVWEFSDYEPHPGQISSYAFYPDIGDIGTYQYMLHGDYEDGFEESYDNPWDYSMIYLYLGKSPPGYFFSAAVEGVPLHDAPHGQPLGEGPEFRISFTQGASIIEREGNWAKVSYRNWDSDTTLEGWVDLVPVNSQGHVVPGLLPLPATYYEP
ncbi:hypothetical protein KAU45_05305, partial [bacterium]|nr:hypothetical protein [bacterium]